MNREDLIEKAAKAIDPSAWLAIGPRWAGEAEARRFTAMRQARSALAVFEEAQKPSEESQAKQNTGSGLAITERERPRQSVYLGADGIHRVNVGPIEPNVPDRPEESHSGGRNVTEAAQAEPSDAAVGVAMNAAAMYYASQGIETEMESVDYSAMRAALRAASSVQGENR